MTAHEYSFRCVYMFYFLWMITPLAKRKTSIIYVLYVVWKTRITSKLEDQFVCVFHISFPLNEIRKGWADCKTIWSISTDMLGMNLTDSNVLSLKLYLISLFYSRFSPNQKQHADWWLEEWKQRLVSFKSEQNCIGTSEPECKELRFVLQCPRIAWATRQGCRNVTGGQQYSIAVWILLVRIPDFLWGKCNHSVPEVKWDGTALSQSSGSQTLSHVTSQHLWARTGAYATPTHSTAYIHVHTYTNTHSQDKFKTHFNPFTNLSYTIHGLFRWPTVHVCTRGLHQTGLLYVRL